MNSTPESLNYVQETSTKIKLKFDHSKIHIAELNGREKAECAEEVVQLKHSQGAIEMSKSADVNNGADRQLMEFDAFYLNKMVSFNLDLVDTRNRLSYKRLCDYSAKQNATGNQFITSHQLPLFLKTPEGNFYYDSNDKFEPQTTNVSTFVAMNLKNEHLVLGTDKGGVQNFAPRRRRRGTGKLLKTKY